MCVCECITRRLTGQFVISQDGTSEEFIGEWAEARGVRDQLVIATKVSPYPIYQSSLFMFHANIVHKHPEIGRERS